MSQNTILTSIDNLDVNNIVFSKPEINNIPGNKLSYKRIRINIKNGDELSDLVLESPPNLLSWGLSEQIDLQSNALNGYQIPVCLWSKNGPTPEEKKFTDTFDTICQYIKNYLVEHRDDIEQYSLEFADLKKFNPLYWKTEKGKVVEDRGPTLYAKCLYNKKTEKVNTLFLNEAENPPRRVNPLSLIGKPCFVKIALKLESIYIGTKISFQVKCQEVMFRPKEVPLRSLLCPEADLNEVLENEVTEEEVEEEVVEEEEIEEDEVVEEEIEEEEELEINKPVPVLPVEKVKAKPNRRGKTPTKEVTV